MNEVASKGQLRGAFLRWAVVTVPLMVLLGFVSIRLAPVGAGNPWYARLAKPDAMPPEWVFPVAWGAMYMLLGLALAIVVTARSAKGRGIGLALFVIQLTFNLGWAPLFFGKHMMSAAFVAVAVAFGLGLVTLVCFARVRTVAALLMLPYVAWLGYAGYQLHRFDQLNPNAESLVPSGTMDQIVL